MFISVIICTRNRASRLQRTVESILCPGNVRESDWELLVVDNASGDGTARVCTELRRRFPRHFRFLTEKKIGKSHALNAALACAEGEVLAFTDDDVVCAPDYLGAIRTVFRSFPVDAAQGRVLFDCEGGWPKWLSERYAAFLGLRDYGDQIAPLPALATLGGANMVVHAHVFAEIGGFSPELGPGGVGVFEDTEVSLRMRERGYRLIYAPGILVHHGWPRGTLTKSLIRKRMFLHGRVQGFYENLPVSLARFALYVAKEILSKEVLAFWQRCTSRPALALASQCRACEQAGFFWQHLLFQRGARRNLSGNLLRPHVAPSIR